MAATGTIAVTNNSKTITGTGTKFTTELAAADIIYTVIQGVNWSFIVDTIASDTSLTITAAYTGNAVSGQQFTAIPRMALTGITGQLAVDTAMAIRGLNYDKANWQQILTSPDNTTVNLPDRSQYTGPSWLSLSKSLSNKANSSDVDDALSKKANNSDLGKLAELNSISRSQLDSEIKGNLFAYGDRNTGVPGTGVYGFGPGQLGFANEYADYGCVIQLTNQSEPSDIAGQYYFQHYLVIGANGVMGYASNINGNYRGGNKIWSQVNTTTNSSGALIPASPIVRLVNSKGNVRQDLKGSSSDEYTWQSDYGLTNDESEGCKISKIETGKYLVTGATSLARDLWQVMDCGNGQGRIIALAEAVETESGIEVRCYKQKYTLTDEGDLTVERGDLIDIPDNTWIDVRLEMPDDSIWNKKQVQPTQDNSTPLRGNYGLPIPRT